MMAPSSFLATIPSAVAAGVRPYCTNSKLKSVAASHAHQMNLISPQGACNTLSQHTVVLTLMPGKREDPHEGVNASLTSLNNRYLLLMQMDMNDVVENVTIRATKRKAAEAAAPPQRRRPIECLWSGQSRRDSGHCRSPGQDEACSGQMWPCEHVLRDITFFRCSGGFCHKVRAICISPQITDLKITRGAAPGFPPPGFCTRPCVVRWTRTTTQDFFLSYRKQEIAARGFRFPPLRMCKRACRKVK